MAALDYLRRAGLTVELEGERLRITPADRITAEHRQLVRHHRAELLAATTDPPPPPAQPEEPQHVVLSATTALPEWRHARDCYIGHLMTCRACHAPTGRYCPAGANLRTVYNSTPMELIP